MCVRVCVRVCLAIPVCTWVCCILYVCVCMRVAYVYTRVYVFLLCFCMYVCACVCVCVHICVSTCVYVCVWSGGQAPCLWVSASFCELLSSRRLWRLVSGESLQKDLWILGFPGCSFTPAGSLVGVRSDLVQELGEGRSGLRAVVQRLDVTLDEVTLLVTRACGPR